MMHKHLRSRIPAAETTHAYSCNSSNIDLVNDYFLPQFHFSSIRMCNPCLANNKTTMSDSSLSTLSWSPCTSPDSSKILSTSEWLSTLKFLESDDCFFGTCHCPEDSHHQHHSALGNFHTSSSSMDVSLTPLPLDSINESVRRNSLASIGNGAHQPLPNTSALSKIDQTIDIVRNVDYRAAVSASSSLLPQAPVSAPAPGQAISSASILQAHRQLVQAASPAKTEEQSSPPKKKRKPRVSDDCCIEQKYIESHSHIPSFVCFRLSTGHIL